MKIFFYVDQFYIGGGGRVASILINGLAERGYEIAVETNITKPFTYTLAKDVKVYPLHVSNKTQKRHQRIETYFKRIFRLRKDIREFQPNLVIAFLANEFVELWLARLGLNIPIIVSDHTSMGRDLGLRVNIIRHRLYSLADRTTILTEKDKRLLGKKNKGKVVVYNPLTYTPLTHFPKKEKIVLCAGRVNSWEVKGYDTMVKLWDSICRLYPEWTLMIAGDCSGSSKDMLLGLCSNSRALESIKFVGQIDNMQPLYEKASIFALPSRVEGFPMVLTEAMSQGCACISFSLDAAIKEIITNGTDGIIVPDRDVEAFRTNLQSLMADDERCRFLGERAMKSVMRFSASGFIDKWIEIIDAVVR